MPLLAQRLGIPLLNQVRDNSRTASGGGPALFTKRVRHHPGCGSCPLVVIYRAAQPEFWRRLPFRLVPLDQSTIVARFYARMGQVLLHWRPCQCAVMLMIGILSGPCFGAPMAAVPATPIPLIQSPLEALWGRAKCGGMSFIAGSFIPLFLVQAETTSLPPVILLRSTVAFSIVFGILAVLLATPLMLLPVIAELLCAKAIPGAAPPQRAGILPAPEEAPC